MCSIPVSLFILISVRNVANIYYDLDTGIIEPLGNVYELIYTWGLPKYSHILYILIIKHVSPFRFQSIMCHPNKKLVGLPAPSWT